MNWQAMTPAEVLNYAPLYATTELERALLNLFLSDSEDRRELESLLEDAQQEASGAESLAKKLGEAIEEAMSLIEKADDGEDVIGDVFKVLQEAPLP